MAPEQAFTLNPPASARVYFEPSFTVTSPSLASPSAAMSRKTEVLPDVHLLHSNERLAKLPSFDAVLKALAPANATLTTPRRAQQQYQQDNVASPQDDYYDDDQMAPTTAIDGSGRATRTARQLVHSNEDPTAGADLPQWARKRSLAPNVTSGGEGA